MLYHGFIKRKRQTRTQTKCKVSAILHLLGNDTTRLTALVDNMLRFVMDIYSNELNYLYEKKNKRRPF